MTDHTICPYVRIATEGTSHCALAEEETRRLGERIRELEAGRAEAAADVAHWQRVCGGANDRIRELVAEGDRLREAIKGALALFSLAANASQIDMYGWRNICTSMGDCLRNALDGESR